MKGKGELNVLYVQSFLTCVSVYVCAGQPVADSPSADVVWPGCILWSPGRLVSEKPQQGSGYRFQ